MYKIIVLAILNTHEFISSINSNFILKITSKIRTKMSESYKVNVNDSSLFKKIGYDQDRPFNDLKSKFIQELEYYDYFY
jgi:hypothetical protein